MFITPAYAQAAGAGDTNSMLMSLLPFALIFVIMYFLILRPQQKKVRDHADLVKNIRRGDTVVTSGGLVGKVTKVVDDDQIEFEISNSICSSSTTFVTLPTSPPVVTTVSPRRMFFTSSLCSLTLRCCGRRIRKYMMTKISANGSSDINMLLVSPAAPAA